MPVAIPDAVFQVDKAILLFIQNNLRYPALTPFFKAVANYGVIILGVYVVLMLLWEKRRIFPIASACVVSGLLGDFIKGYLKKSGDASPPLFGNTGSGASHQTSKRVFFPIGAHHPGFCHSLYHQPHFAETVQHPCIFNGCAGCVFPPVPGRALSHRHFGRHLHRLRSGSDHGLFV